LNFKFLNLLLAASNYQPPVKGMAQTLPKGPEDDASSYASLLSAAQNSNETCEQVNNRANFVIFDFVELTLGPLQSLFYHRGMTASDTMHRSQRKNNSQNFLCFLPIRKVDVEILTKALMLTSLNIAAPKLQKSLSGDTRSPSQILR